MFANTQMLGVSTALGSEGLGLTGFTGGEALSRLFSFQLELYAPNAVENVAGALLGEPISFNLEQRQFHGICSRISQGESNTTHTPYFAEVVPWLWLLTLNRNTRGFAERSVPDILQQVFDGRPVEFELQGSFEPRPYVLQRNESDFQFVSRLMEEEGIFYFFRHSTDGHRLVVANSRQSCAHTPGTR
jgi:type VI secretion system secreted protein VgrG